MDQAVSSSWSRRVQLIPQNTKKQLIPPRDHCTWASKSHFLVTGAQRDREVMAGDDGDDGMQCSDHPHRSNPDGVCAFCLQERLGELVSSSKASAPFFPVPSPTRTSPDDVAAERRIPTTVVGVEGDGTPAAKPPRGGPARIPFFHHGSSHGYWRRRKSGVRSTGASTAPAAPMSGVSGGGFLSRRSKSVAPRMVACGLSGGDSATVVGNPRKRWLWSFLHFSSDPTGNLKHEHHQQEQEQKQKDVSEAPIGKPKSSITETTPTDTTIEEPPHKPKKDDDVPPAAAAVDEAECSSESQASSSLGQKVARSRSVECGSRSFSGDFLDCISIGFDDCTFQRVKSQRDPKPKNGEEEVESKRRQKMRCGGILGGMGMTSSSYWLPMEFGGCAGRMSDGGGTPHCRGKGWWGWTFANPIRALRPSSSKSYVTTTAAASSVA